MTIVNRRRMLGSLLGIPIVADAAMTRGRVVLERRPTIARIAVQPVCPVCGLWVWWTERAVDPFALRAVQCGCGWTGHARESYPEPTE